MADKTYTPIEQAIRLLEHVDLRPTHHEEWGEDVRDFLKTVAPELLALDQNCKGPTFLKELELIRIAEAAYRIMTTGADEETKYDLVFSKEIRGRQKELDPHFGWYDPDTTYLEDAWAYVNALEKKAAELRKALGVKEENRDG